MYFDANPAPFYAPDIRRVGIGGEQNTSQEGSYLYQLKSELSIDVTLNDYDEALLAKLRTAISAVEQFTRLGLYPAVVTITYAGYDGAPLPFGPVWATPAPVITPASDGSSVHISYGNSALSGGDFPFLTGGFESGTVTFTGGYSMETIPDVETQHPNEGLIGAVVDHAATSFRTGNITGAGNPGTYWKTLAAPFRRF